MNPISLTIKNFMCYEDAKLDFSKFDSALIIGKTNNNLHISNGSGKSSLFGAIEYSLFGEFGDLKLDKIVKEDKPSCMVEFEFSIQDRIFKIIRSRSSKGTSNVQLFEKLEDWKDISGRRNSDTENQINKLIKINAKSFRNSTHFVQRDMSGITNLKPQERKKVLKEIFDLSVYVKLEKLAKEKLSNLNKDFIKLSAIVEDIGDPKSEIEKLQFNLDGIKHNYESNEQSIVELSSSIKELVDNKSNLSNKIKTSLANLPALSQKEKELNSNKLSLISEIDSLKNNLKINQNKLNELNKQLNSFSKPDDSLENKIQNSNDLILKLSNDKSKIEGSLRYCQNEIVRFKNAASISECQNCLQRVPDAHSENLKNALASLQEEQSNLTKDLDSKNKEINNQNKIYNELKKLLERQNADIRNIYLINTNITNIKNSISIIENNILNKENSLNSINKEIESIIIEKSKISIDQINKDKELYNNIVIKIRELESKLNILLENKNNYIKNISIIENNISQNNDKIIKLENTKKSLSLIDEELKVYNIITEAFSSSGIPSFIINNLLDEVQEKANDFCSKIKPGLQIEFLISKENSNGDEVDTLDIKYFYNGKEREYNQLSGAMKFNVTFSIKLALSIIIQQILDTEIKFFLFDEIDSPLDVYSSNEFVNIIKELQKEYKILLITHGESLKDKFINKIIVEQNSSGASTIIQN